LIVGIEPYLFFRTVFTKLRLREAKSAASRLFCGGRSTKQRTAVTAIMSPERLFA